MENVVIWAIVGAITFSLSLAVARTCLSGLMRIVAAEAGSPDKSRTKG
jgi:hypothetical protein